jgi:hypothetical protein
MLASDISTALYLWQYFRGAGVTFVPDSVAGMQNAFDFLEFYRDTVFFRLKSHAQINDQMGCITDGNSTGTHQLSMFTLHLSREIQQYREIAHQRPVDLMQSGIAKLARARCEQMDSDSDMDDDDAEGRIELEGNIDQAWYETHRNDPDLFSMIHVIAK